MTTPQQETTGWKAPERCAQTFSIGDGSNHPEGIPLCEVCYKKTAYKSTFWPGRGTIQVCKACSYGVTPVVSGLKKTGRNDPCPCGSGQKFKRCCLVLEK